MAAGFVLVVGAGLSGAVLARALAEAGRRVRVIDARAHVAGNCHTERDAETGVLVHVYGPHIFHTDDAGVWDHVNRFARFRPYRHRVRAVSGGRVYALPVNLHTINQLYGTAMGPAEARAFLAARCRAAPGAPRNFEEQALHLVGPEIYAAFFRGYTEKQWGCAPEALPAAVFSRLPVRFGYDDDYFSHRFQGMPEAGYTAMVAAMLDHPGIELRLSAPFAPVLAEGAAHLFWTGAIDGWFGGRLGWLGYRTLEFERFTAAGDHQGCAVMNYADRDVPWTRITEHKHFAPWESHAATVCHREYPRAAGPGDVPHYPVRLAGEQALLARYVALARAEARGVTFLGRLGTYRYLDMDAAIREALDVAAAFLRPGGALPAFCIDPLTGARQV